MELPPLGQPLTPISSSAKGPIPPPPSPPKKSLKARAQEVAVRIFVTIASIPPLIIGALSIASSHVVQAKGDDLWSKLVSIAILPASAMKQSAKLDPSIHAIPIKIDVPGTDIKLDGALALAKGVSPEAAAHLPTVVIFNQNAAFMEHHSATIKEYQGMGCNVVVFNYRGVGNSTGKTTSGADLVADGEAVIDQLTKDGFDVTTQVGLSKQSINIKAKKENILLYGSSIGGAVASAVGKKHPNMMLVVDRSFTSWLDAAKSMVTKYTNPIFGILAKKMLAQDENKILDNIANLKERLADKNHAFTLIETAEKQGGGDGLLTPDIQLSTQFEAQVGSDPNLHFNKLKNTHHNDWVPIYKCEALEDKLVDLAKDSGYALLFELGKFEAAGLAPIKDNEPANLITELKRALKQNANELEKPLVQKEIDRLYQLLSDPEETVWMRSVEEKKEAKSILESHVSRHLGPPERLF